MRIRCVRDFSSIETLLARAVSFEGSIGMTVNQGADSDSVYALAVGIYVRESPNGGTMDRNHGCL